MDPNRPMIITMADLLACARSNPRPSPKPPLWLAPGVDRAIIETSDAILAYLNKPWQPPEAKG